ncbi:KAP family P-loop NTPase fold protein [Bacillus paranthracis]|uniref:KAP family P-loop NTPase fold protein n=1 Tax=Bacillus paranthracis TaxID=2026186 RepID=UPI003DA9805F
MNINIKKLFGVGIGSIFIYFILSVCRMNLSTLNSLIENNMMKLFFIVSFTFALCFVSYININLERRGLYYKEYGYLPKRYLVQMMFWLGIGFNYLTPPFYQMDFQGNLLSILFDMAFYYSLISLGLFGILLIKKIVRKQKTKKLQEQKSSSKPYFYSDNPVSNNRDDKLNREKFVNNVVSNLYKMKEENLTIGFYGKWGTGKTSIFKMIKKTIENDDDKKNEYLIFEFKPWYFGKDNHEIVVEFLEQLLNEIKRSRGFDPHIEKNIIQYSKAFSSVSLRIPGITVNFKETHSLIEELFDTKSKNIKDLKDEVEESLRNSSKRIIVFIDDIDRLNKEEIQMVFRLVRLICDFPNITYIVALDEEIVAAALAELHGKDVGVDAKKIGRDYLEKFIQIPLYIPETDAYSMNEMLWNGIRDILEENGLSRESDFLTLESSSTKRCIDLQKLGFTPRNIYRYLNTAKFMVPLMKHETNIDDLLYLLLIKIGSPGLYEKIRLSPTVFIEPDVGDKDLLGRIKKDFFGYKDIIMKIFPEFDRESNGSKESYAIERKNRICSKDYFKRYFTYDISDSERKVSIFIKKLKVKNIEVLSKEFEGFLHLYSKEKIFSIIEYNIDKLTKIESQNLIKVIQSGLNKERENSLNYYTGEYIRILSLLSIYLGEENDNPIFSSKFDLWLINRVYKILDSYYLYSSKISTINVVKDEMVNSFIFNLENRVKEYCSSNTLENIFGEYAIEEGAEFISLWNKFEVVEKKREITKTWIRHKAEFEKLVGLLLYSNDNKSGALSKYSKVIELIDIEIINRNLKEIKGYDKKDYPNSYELLAISEYAIEKELFHRLQSEEDECLRNEDIISYSIGLRRNLEVLQKYGDENIKSKINDYLKSVKKHNKEIAKIKAKMMN